MSNRGPLLVCGQQIAELTFDGQNPRLRKPNAKSFNNATPCCLAPFSWTHVAHQLDSIPNSTIEQFMLSAYWITCNDYTMIHYFVGIHYTPFRINKLSDYYLFSYHLTIIVSSHPYSKFNGGLHGWIAFEIKLGYRTVISDRTFFRCN